MEHTVQNLINIKKNIDTNVINLKINKSPIIIAVSKTFGIEKIMPLIKYGHIHFGENKVQEAFEKWSSVKDNFLDLKLHMIGKLQTNKVKFLFPLFDYLHSLDNLKLAKKISEHQSKNEKKIKIFIQVNIGEEGQKAGININELNEFYSICIKDLKLNIIGLMCLPPVNENTDGYFQQMEKLNKQLGLQELSLGMSNDYLDAIKYGSTYVRIGSKIFGNRS